jgi:hypothetical protein
MRLLLLSAAAVLTFLPGLALADTVVVSPDNLNGWAFSNTDNSGTNASGGFVSGPATAPLGSGSAQFIVGDSSSSEILYDLSLDSGMSVSDFTSFSYSTYRDSPAGVDSVLEAALAINIAIDGKYAGRLVYEPYLTGTTTLDNTWQSWNPMTGSGWYDSHNASGTCSMASPCSWDTLMSNYGTATVDYGLLFKAGSGWNSFQGNVDAFTVGTTQSDTPTTFDFEPSTVPEPASMGMLGFAVAGLLVLRRRGVRARWSIRG